MNAPVKPPAEALPQWGLEDLYAGREDPRIEVDIEAGKEYFIRIDYSPNASFAIRATPVVVPLEVGRQETKKLRPLDGWLVEDATCGK